jgi:Flp pilus assembly protein TadG
MDNVQPKSQARKGVIAPLTAVLLIPVLGMMAFSVDAGYLVMARAELQNAADSAAMAAAEQLQPYYVQYYTPGAAQATVYLNAVASGTRFAQTYTGFHRAGGVANLVIDTANDLKFGYQDAYTPFQSPPPAGYFPNTVEVTLRLDGGQTTNPQINLFFGPVLGVKTATMTAVARATIYTGDLSDFTGPDLNLLPATLDLQIWQSFVATGKGSLPDFSYTAPTLPAPLGAPAPAVAGAPQILVVPDPNGRPGGWNYLSLDSSSNSNSDFKGWFSTGLQQSDLNSLHTGGQLPLPAQPSDSTRAPYYWKGSPGDRGDSEPFPAPGAVRILPLYLHVPVSQSGAGNYVASDKNQVWNGYDGQYGRGQNSWFNIVQFVGVVVTDNSSGLNVQPAAVSDPNMKLINVAPAGPPVGNNLKTLFTAPKLSL